MSLIPLKGKIEPCGSVRDLLQDVELGLILWSVPVEPAKNPPFLQAMNPVVAPNFFLPWLLNICVLLILKIWLMPSCSYCRALLKAGCPFFTDIPCTHGVCLLSLGSFVPVMFCFSWNKAWKSQMIPVFLLQSCVRLWSQFLFGKCTPLFKNWLAFTGKGIYLSAKLLKTWWWCLAKWSSLEIFKGLWEFQLVANLCWACPACLCVVPSPISLPQ